MSSRDAATASELRLRICVFGSATLGTNPVHVDAARSLARALHANNGQLVYGGGTTGLMGELAKTFVSLSGAQDVHGIIPRNILEFERPAIAGAFGSVKPKHASSGSMGKTLKKRLGLTSATSKNGSAKSPGTKSALLSESVYGRAHVVADLQTRKKRMCQLVEEGAPGSGFIALSGGFGTMDELMEMITLRQYGIHTRRICLFNIDGFWDLFLAWMEAATEKGFVRDEATKMIAVVKTADECLAWLRNT